MSWYSRNLNQTAAYWGPPILDAWGDQTYPSAATMRCHWKEEARQFVSPSGVEFTSHAVVHLEDEVNPNGYLYLLSSATAPTGQPTAVSGAERIQQVEKRPTVRQDVVVYVAFL